MPPATALSLVSAMIARSDGPLLLLDGDLAIVAASNVFSRMFHLVTADIIGKPVFAMGGGEWDMPRFRSLLNAVRGGTETSLTSCFSILTANAGPGAFRSMPRKSTMTNPVLCA